MVSENSAATPIRKLHRLYVFSRLKDATTTISAQVSLTISQQLCSSAKSNTVFDTADIQGFFLETLAWCRKRGQCCMSFSKEEFAILGLYQCRGGTRVQHAVRNDCQQSGICRYYQVACKLSGDQFEESFRADKYYSFNLLMFPSCLIQCLCAVKLEYAT